MGHGAADAEGTHRLDKALEHPLILYLCLETCLQELLLLHAQRDEGLMLGLVDAREGLDDLGKR